MAVKRGQIYQDGCYHYSDVGEGVGEIRVENGRVIWWWNQGCEDMGKANKTNIEKAIRELKKTEKHVLDNMY